MDWKDFLGGAADIGTTAALAEDFVKSQREAGQTAYNRAEQLGKTLAAESAGTFKPFTVSTGLGPGITVGQEGGLTVTMPESQEEAAREIARRGTGQLMGVLGSGKLQEEQERLQGMLLGPDIGTAQQDVFSQLQALRAPEQERQRLALENRLFQQGREGIRTAQYGGTPEQLAMAKAIQEQQAADALTARQQALTEQQQRAGLIAEALGQGRQQQALQAELGLGGVQAAFLPQQQALSLLSAATPFSELGTRAGLQGMLTRGELGIGGLEALTAGESAAAATEREYLNVLRDALFGGDSANPSLFTQGLGFLQNLSDIRLKTNIKKVGQVTDEIGLYTWDWTEKGKELAKEQPTFGVLAQEVIKTIPEAVAKGIDGFFRVDYSKILQAGI